MTLDAVFGAGDDLAAHQMAARAFVLFFVTLLIVRVAGMRAFGHGSAFDTIVVIMLGSILARGVVGVSPVVPTVVAAAVLAVVHRGLAMAGVLVPRVARTLNGAPRVLYREGHFDERAMLLAGVSHRDVEQAARADGCADLGDVERAFLETTGEISVIRKQA